ncbi:MAG: sigma-70 family RNA polymerase sigma factor, partial [Planctomycetaceae bacterium]|nr:sigma-70 family RNA polymerase sigma factor [Planctomycetaceae bacterium]
MLAGIRACDEQAWAQFVDEYSPLIYVWCRKCDLQSADARDVSQQVFHAVSRSIATYSEKSGSGSFRGWLFTITRNLVRNHLTRTLRGPRPQGGTSMQLRLLDEPEAIEEESLSAATSASTPSSMMQTILDAARTEFDAHVAMLLEGRHGGTFRSRGSRTIGDELRCGSPGEIPGHQKIATRLERFPLSSNRFLSNALGR